MAYPFRLSLVPVILLTLTCFVGCSFMERHATDVCKNRAFIGQDLNSYLTARFNSGSPVRMAVIPFTAPVNLSPKLGLEVAEKVHQEILPTGEVPIVELFNRVDWPGKKDEFYSGNYGAIAFGREAGYDLVLVGYILPQNNFDRMTVLSKIIDVDSGITVYYGQSNVETWHRNTDISLDSLYLERREPSRMYQPALINEAARCVVRGIKQDEEYR